MYRIGGKRLGENWKSKAGEDGTVGDRIGTAWSVEAGMEGSVTLGIVEGRSRRHGL